MSYSEKLSTHYLAIAKSPISLESFVGADVRFSNEYEALERELNKAQSMHGGGQVDWSKVVEGSEQLLRTQSKDLRVAAWLAWALYQCESFRGLLAGISLLQHLCKHHWPEVHPLRNRTRAASIGWLVPRLEQALGDDVAIKEQLPMFRHLAQQLESLDAACSAQLGDDAPLLLPLCRRLNTLIQHTTENLPQPGAIEAVVAQVKQVATQLMTPGAPIESEKQAHKALRTQQEGAQQLCAWWLKQKATDVRALRLNRTLLWLTIDVLPERNAEQVTPLRGLPADKSKMFSERFQQGHYADLLVDIEASLAKAPFWFDGHRLAWECLQGLNAEQAMREVEIHFALFMARLPGVIELRWHDGGAFADPATRAWIETHVVPHLQRPSVAPCTDVAGNQPPWEQALEEARSILHQDGLKAAIRSLRQGMQTVQGARERFLWRFAMARLCFCARKYELAKVQLEALDRTLQHADLQLWEPELVLQVLHLLHNCYELLPQSHTVREHREETYRRLCHLDLEQVIE